MGPELKGEDRGTLTCDDSHGRSCSRSRSHNHSHSPSTLQRGIYEVFAASVGLAGPGPELEGGEQHIGRVPFVRYLTDLATLRT